MLVGLAWWVGAAWAGPGVIVEVRVEAFVAPSREASVAAQLGQGAQVCVLDSTNHSGVLVKRLGWLAIRLPGGVGYVPAEAVDLSAPAPEVRDCGAPASEPADPAAPAARLQDIEQPRLPRGARTAAGSPAAASAGDAAIDRPPLFGGRFVALHPTGFVLNFGSGSASLNKQAAAQHRIGDSGATFNGALAFTIWDVVMLSVAFSAAFPSDNGSFNQVVVPDHGGDPRTAESSLSVHSVSFAGGLRTPYLALGASGTGWVATALFTEYGGATQIVIVTCS